MVLLLQARKQRTATRKNAAGEKDGFSDSELFESLEIETLRSDPPHYKDITQCLKSDDFLLMCEFKKAREYFSRLLDSHFAPSDDLFDLFQ